MIKKKLIGKRILITRAREQSFEFATKLRSLGAEVIEFPTIEISPPRSWKKLDWAIHELGSYEWIIFTSANGVHFFWQRLVGKGKRRSLPPTIKVCAIGPATAKQLKARGIRIDYIPQEFVAESILKGFKNMDLQGARILLARARMARDVLPKGLRKMGAEVDIVEVYRTLKPRGGSKKLKQLLKEKRIDVITFTSSSTVKHFAELLKNEDLKSLLKGVVIACIGPVTTKTAKKWGMRVHIQPKQYTILSLTQAIVEYFASHPTPLSEGRGRA